MENSFQVGELIDGTPIYTVHKYNRPLTYNYSIGKPADECSRDLIDVRSLPAYTSNADTAEFPFTSEQGRTYHIGLLQQYTSEQLANMKE